MVVSSIEFDGRARNFWKGLMPCNVPIKKIICTMCVRPIFFLRFGPLPCTATASIVLLPYTPLVILPLAAQFSPRLTYHYLCTPS